MAEKTNAMRILDQKKIQYLSHFFDCPTAISGVEIAAMLGEEETNVFKTLVTVGASGNHYVFVVPVAEELDLKKAAKVVNEKNIAMVKSKELLPLTGYVHGGCSPVGMKKFFQTSVHESANLCDRIYVSGGRIGCQIEISLQELAKAIPFITADLIIK